MKRFHQILLALALTAFSQLALAGGGGKAPPAAPPPPPAPEMPQPTKSAEPATFKRKNKQAGTMGTTGTMLTETDATQAEAGVNLGGNTLLGS
jgi:hypothetical protein